MAFFSFVFEIVHYFFTFYVWLIRQMNRSYFTSSYITNEPMVFNFNDELSSDKADLYR